MDWMASVSTPCARQVHIDMIRSTRHRTWYHIAPRSDELSPELVGNGKCQNTGKRPFARKAPCRISSYHEPLMGNTARTSNATVKPRNAFYSWWGKRKNGFMNGSVYQRKCSGVGCCTPEHEAIKASNMIFLSMQMDTTEGGEDKLGQDQG